MSDGTVEADSVEELLAYQRASQNGHSIRRAKTATSDEATDTLPATAKKLVDVLLVHPDGMDTADAARALGLKNTKGIGGFVGSLTAWGRKNNWKKRQLVVKERRPDGKGRTVRTIKLGGQFRKIAEEGKVPGLKRDI